MNEANGADWLAATASLCTALLTLGLLLAAWKGWQTAKEALNASREASEAALRSAQAALAANEQARRDSIERTRPYVFARLEPSLTGVGCVDLVISNSGQSSAKGLTLQFDRWPEEMDDICESLREMFETPRTLPPGCSLRVIWMLDGGDRGFTDGTKTGGLTADGTLSVHYRSDDPCAPRYRDEFEAMIGNSGLWPVPESGTDPPQRWDNDKKAAYRLAQVLVRRVGELAR